MGEGRAITLSRFTGEACPPVAGCHDPVVAGEGEIAPHRVPTCRDSTVKFEPSSWIIIITPSIYVKYTVRDSALSNCSIVDILCRQQAWGLTVHRVFLLIRTKPKLCGRSYIYISAASYLTIHSLSKVLYQIQSQ